MKHSILFCLALTFGAALAQAQVVATVGNTKITLKDFKAKYEPIKRNTMNPPSPEVFLEDLVKFEMGVQEAEKRNLQNNPEVKDLMRQTLYKYLVESELGKRVDSIKITEGDLRAFYEKNPQIRISHIMTMLPEKATEAQIAAAKKRSDEIYKEVKGSKRPFEELVKLYSDDDVTKISGGDLGYISRVTAAPYVYDIIGKMKNGEISTPIRTQFGFQIVKVTGRLGFQDADKSQIRAAVFDTKRAALFEEYFSKLRPKYKVTKDEAALKSLK
jgi:parvulin-like peptidyl-prolyl isomerase